MNIPLWYEDEVLLSSDLNTGFGYVSSWTSDQFINKVLYAGASWVVVTGLTVTADTPADNGVGVATGVAVQSGKLINPDAFNANILPGSYPYGTGLAADPTNPRWDAVGIQYTTATTNTQSRVFEPPATSPQNVATEQIDSFSVSVVHGTPAALPTKPAVPSGYALLAYVYVPAASTTVTAGNVYSQDAANTVSGGRLGYASGGILWRNDANTTPELDTASGVTFKLGTSGASLFDNTSAGYLDIAGASASGIRFLSPVTFASNYTLTAAGGLVMPSGTAISGAGGMALTGASTLAALTTTGLLTASGGATVPSGQVLTNNGTWAGTKVPNSMLAGNLVSAITAGTNVTVSNPTGVGAATVNVPNMPWSGLTGVPSLVNTFNSRLGPVVPTSGDYSFSMLSGHLANTQATGPLVTALTATNGLTVSNPSGVGAASYSLQLNGTSLALGSSGLSINTNNSNAWGALQTFSAGLTVNSGQTLTNSGSWSGTKIPNSMLAGSLVTGLTATNGLTISGSGVGAYSYSLVLNGSSLSLTSSGLSLNLANSNTWNATQRFAAITASSVASSGPVTAAQSSAGGRWRTTSEGGTTGSITYVNLISLPVSCATACSLLITVFMQYLYQFSEGFALARVTVDGTVYATIQGGNEADYQAQSQTYTDVVSVGAGAHTINLDYCATESGPDATIGPAIVAVAMI